MQKRRFPFSVPSWHSQSESGEPSVDQQIAQGFEGTVSFERDQSQQLYPDAFADAEPPIAEPMLEDIAKVENSFEGIALTSPNVVL